MATKIRLAAIGFMVSASSGAVAQVEPIPSMPVQGSTRDQMTDPTAPTPGPLGETPPSELTDPTLTPRPAPPVKELPPVVSVPADVTVANRARPDFDPAGLKAGSFIVYPSVSITPAYSDNLFAVQNNKQGDASVTFLPEVKFQSDFSRHSLGGRAYFSQRYYDKFDSENASQYGAGLNGVIDITRRSRFRYTVQGDHRAEDRYNVNSFQSTASPVRYDTLYFNGEFTQEFNFLRFTVGGTASKENFKDAKDGAGAPLDQDYRDLTTRGGFGRLEYEFRPGVGVFARVEYDDRNYRVRPGNIGFTGLDRSSQGWRYEGGIAFELSRLMTGEIRVGYRKRKYDDNTLLDSNGLVYAANLLWSVTPLTSITLDVNREVEETSSATLAGNLRSEARLTIDHELLRNLILTANGRYATINPVNQPGTTDEYEGELAATYLLNRRASVETSFRHVQRGSGSFFSGYKANSVYLTLKFGL